MVTGDEKNEASKFETKRYYKEPEADVSNNYLTVLKIMKVFRRSS